VQVRSVSFDNEVAHLRALEEAGLDVRASFFEEPKGPMPWEWARP
jgi:hypothetical protein